MKPAGQITDWLGIDFDLKTADHAKGLADLMLSDGIRDAVFFLRGSADGHLTGSIKKTWNRTN